MPVEIEGAVPMLLVYDVPTSIAFYRDLLGFSVLNTSRPFDDAKDNYGWAYLRLNNVDLMLNNAYEDNIRPAKPDAQRTSAHRDTTLYLATKDVDAVYQYLRTQGINATAPDVTYYGMRQVQVFDPDGYSLVFQSADISS
jgi:glyoxylase I family protein